MNRFLLLLMLPLLPFLAACNDDFLERSPEDKVSDGAVWKTPEHLKLYVNNFYNRGDLLPSYGNSVNDMGVFTLDRDNGSDTQIGLSYNTRLNGEGVVPATGGGWSTDDWATLRNVSYFFANYGKASGNQAEINRYVGEARFFRALFYFNKLRAFGDLPIYAGLLNIGDAEALYKPRDRRDKVVEWMMGDLDTAVSYLPSRTEGWSGRVNKEAAMLLQARIALYEGTWEKYHAQENTPFKVPGKDGASFLQKAAAVTDSLIGMGTCQLDNVGEKNGYWRLFNRESYAASNEVIFWRQYADNVLTHYWASYSANGGGTGLTKSMVDSYLCDDGKPIGLSAGYRGDSTLLQVVENRDPRLRQTIYVNDGQHLRYTEPNDTFRCPTFTGSNDNKCATGYQLYKGHNPDRERASTQRGITALIYFRYAEALLINAEAKAALGVITQGDLDKTINKLRGRVGMPHLSLAEVNSWNGNSSYAKEFPGESALINEVRRERKVELAAEGFRTDDLFRWAAAKTLVRNRKPLGARRAQWESLPDSIVGNIRAIPIDKDGYIEPYKNTLSDGYKFNYIRDYLLPIPSTERVLNPELEQNPGW